MTEQKHTPAPWQTQYGPNGAYILDAQGRVVGSAREESDARRIVAAVNAVEGLSTEALEAGVVAEMQRCLAALVSMLTLSGSCVNCGNSNDIGHAPDEWCSDSVAAVAQARGEG